MTEKVWFVYQNSKQLGPFDTAEITQMLSSNMILDIAFLFKAGWKDWRPLEECQSEFALIPTLPPPPVSASNRRKDAPRASIEGRIIIHNNGDLIMAKGVNISVGGIFVETQEALFKLGEKLKLTCSIDQFSKPFNVICKVVRFNNDPAHAPGYGLVFVELDPKIPPQIQKLLDLENVRGKAG
jgi:Tfp pilus assembly protein PilZ